MKTTLLAASLLLIPFSGCLDLFGSEDHPFDRPLSSLSFEVPDDLTGDVDADDLQWPDLKGANLTVLSHGAFASFPDAAARFKELTGAVVTEVPADDTGSALALARQDAGDSVYDVIYGLDNMLLAKAVDEGVLAPYKPQLSPRVLEPYRFLGEEVWHATPVDHGIIALNVDADHESLDSASDDGCASLDDPADGTLAPVQDLADVRGLSCLFVTQDPNTSTPGLGFLLITIDAFGEEGGYDWTRYWEDLFLGPDARRCSGDEVKITSGWTEAYQNHFTGGYGNADWNNAFVGGYPIVTSYSESPAYEIYFGMDQEDAAVSLHEAGAFHQIQTMGILKGTKNLAVAQAWIEFTLTDDFQELSAPKNAVYPVVNSVDTNTVYGPHDPRPGSFETVDMDWRTIGDNLDRWIDTWTDLHQEHSCPL